MAHRVQNSSGTNRAEKWKNLDYKKMDAETLNRLLQVRIEEMERQGLVDQHFFQLLSLKEDSGPTFFLDLIPAFVNGVHTIVYDMAMILCQQVVDFGKMYSQYIKLKGSSSCFGACRIRGICANLNLAIENNSKDGCLEALNRIKDEINHLDEQLESVTKIESEIVSRTSGQ